MVGEARWFGNQPVGVFGKSITRVAKHAFRVMPYSLVGGQRQHSVMRQDEEVPRATMKKQQPPDGLRTFIDRIKAKQRNTVWPDPLVNSRSARRVSLEGLF